MKKQISRLLIGGLFILATTISFIVKQDLPNQGITLHMKNIEALADGEASECTRACFDEKCVATIENVDCHVTCGSTACKFTYAYKKV